MSCGTSGFAPHLNCAIFCRYSEKLCERRHQRGAATYNFSANM
jgi:hypothetical protein